MKAEEFQGSLSGEVIQASAQTREGLIDYCAFVPKPLPPTLPMDEDLWLALSNADRALGELAGLGRSIATVQLLISAFIRREAVLSSRIEGTRTGIADLYAFEAGQLMLPGTEPGNLSDAREVFNYVLALEYGLGRVKEIPVGLQLIKELHHILLKDLEGVRGGQAHPGEFRSIQNMIMSDSGDTLRSARFVPPPVLQMLPALVDLDEYILGANEYPPLIRLALIHYQFETIHPFEDGNGRIGRLLVSLLLVHWNLLPSALLDLSAFINKHKDTYCDLLFSVSRDSVWRDWVKFFLLGISEQAADAANRTKQLLDLREEWRARLTEAHASALTLRLVDSLFEMPVLTVPKARELLGVTFVTAQRNVEKLIKANILQEIGKTPQGRAYVADGIIRILREA